LRGALWVVGAPCGRTPRRDRFTSVTFPGGNVVARFVNFRDAAVGAQTGENRMTQNDPKNPRQDQEQEKPQQERNPMSDRPGQGGNRQGQEQPGRQGQQQPGRQGQQQEQPGRQGQQEPGKQGGQGDERTRR
jgi:hypothetical protein